MYQREEIRWLKGLASNICEGRMDDKKIFHKGPHDAEEEEEVVEEEVVQEEEEVIEEEEEEEEKEEGNIFPVHFCIVYFNLSLHFSSCCDLRKRRMR